MKDSGNTALITGGTSGIGYALAETFLAMGNEVLVCAQREERLREAQKKLPGLHVKACDVAVQSERESLAEVDSELNPEGRAKRGGFKVDLQPREFVAAVTKGLADDLFEIGCSYTLQSLKASREDLDKAFQQMNSRW